jgi:hypothetical protein
MKSPRWRCCSLRVARRTLGPCHPQHVTHDHGDQSRSRHACAARMVPGTGRTIDQPTPHWRNARAIDQCLTDFSAILPQVSIASSSLSDGALTCIFKGAAVERRRLDTGGTERALGEEVARSWPCGKPFYSCFVLVYSARHHAPRWRANRAALQNRGDGRLRTLRAARTVRRGEADAAIWLGRQAPRSAPGARSGLP